MRPVTSSAAAPDRTYAILEARETIGGTWDLFRYPGIRSDSDMHTLGYSFRPWEDAQAIADGPSILRYVRDTADEYGVTDQIRFGHRVAERGVEHRGSAVADHARERGRPPARPSS